MKRFSPFAQVTATEGRIAVLFDSGHADDQTRNPRIVCFPRLHSGISWELNETEGAAFVLKLLVHRAEGDTRTEEHELAKITIPRISAHQVRQAVAAAISAAFSAYYQWDHVQAGRRGVGAPHGPGPLLPEHWPEDGPPRSRAANHSMFKVVKRLVLPSVVVVLLAGGIYVAGMGVGAVTGHSVMPIQDAVAKNVGQNMAQDPASIQAQVELTQETLRQMGLDPGRPGDLGCLAPQ